MIVQDYRSFHKDPENGCFIYGKSREEIYDDLLTYAKDHDEDGILYYEMGVKPSKVNLRPEYSMEVELWDGHSFPLCFSIYRRPKKMREKTLKDLKNIMAFCHILGSQLK